MRQGRRRTLVAAVAGALVAGFGLVGSASGVSDQQVEGSASGQAQQRPSKVAGCRVFPADNYWHADVRHLPVHPRSGQWLARMSPGVDLHPDFGPSFGDGPDYGIPVTVVRRSHPRVPVRFRYADESDRVRYPFGHDTRIEGGRGSSGDKHAVVVDRGTCRLYETWDTTVARGRWAAGSGATWSLRSNRLRPERWTSADAAGLPILPGLLRWTEVRNGTLDHAVRFTTDRTSAHHLWPARHDASAITDPRFPPMGARFRLRASFSTDGYSRYARVVIRAFKRYGLVLADNGSPWYFQGEQNAGWPPGLVDELKSIPASAFVAVDTASLMARRNSGRVR